MFFLNNSIFSAFDLEKSDKNPCDGSSLHEVPLTLLTHDHEMIYVSIGEEDGWDAGEVLPAPLGAGVHQRLLLVHSREVYEAHQNHQPALRIQIRWIWIRILKFRWIRILELCY